MKPKTFKFNSLIEVEWLDIVEESSWLPFLKASRFPAAPCKSVGYFLNRDDIIIRISASIGKKDTERNVLVIPWGCIGKIRELK